MTCHLAQQLEACRWTYNEVLAERKRAYEERGETLRRYDRQALLPVWKLVRPALKLVHSQVLQNVCVRADHAFHAFFRRVKTGDPEPGCPRFKGFGRYNSITYPQYGNGVRLDGERLIHRDAQETRGRPEERMQRKLARFRALFRLGYRPEELRTLIRLLDHLLRLTPGLQEMARATMRQIEREETGMETLITSFEELAREEGVQEGLVKGRQEGLVEGQRDLVLRLLTHKLGALDEALRVRVATLDPETLLRLSDALFDFVTTADLGAWLAALSE